MKHFSLKGKILLIATFMTTVSAVISITSYVYSQKTKEAFETIVHNDVPSIRALNRMLLSFRMARIDLLQLVASESSLELKKESLKGIETQLNNYKLDEAKLLPFVDTKEEKELFEIFKKNTDHFSEELHTVTAFYANDALPSPKDRTLISEIVFTKLPAIGNEVRDSTKALVDHWSNEIENHTEEAAVTSKKGTMMSLIVTTVGLFLGFLISILLSNGIVKELNNVIETIFKSSDHLTSVSTQIENSSGGLSQAATEQAASLEETAASLEQISAMIAKASESAQTTAENSTVSQKKAEEGRMAVDQVLMSMKEINVSNEAILHQVEQSNQEMNEIVNVIHEIGNKTKVIHEIVFQTKLLSFNASVEAARAGEHGKGFAVVAEEVGNLAQMSGNAAKEITQMLEQGIIKVESVVNSTKSSVGALVQEGKLKVETGIHLTEQCTNVLNDIVKNVTKVSDLAQDISQATKEQALGVSEINKAMTQLDSVTQQNSASSAEAANAAKDLSEESESLKSAIEKLLETVQAKKAA